MHRILLLIALFSGITLSCFAGDGKSPDRQKLDSMEAALIRMVNEHRSAKGLPPLKQHAQLSEMARQHSQRMAAGRIKFSHDGFSDRKKAYKKKTKGWVGMFGENVAKGSHDADGAMEQWLDSLGHRQNIEGAFQYIGVGIARSKEGMLYFTQIFASE